MSRDLPETEDYVDEVLAGQRAIVAALVIALHENGVLPQDRYCDALQRLWDGMAEDEAVGEAGAVIERMFDLLAAHDYRTPPSEESERNLNIRTVAARPVNDDSIARPAPTPFRSLILGICKPKIRA